MKSTHEEDNAVISVPWRRSRKEILTLTIWIGSEAKKAVSVESIEKLQGRYGRKLIVENNGNGIIIRCPCGSAPFTPQSMQRNLRDYLGLEAMIQKENGLQAKTR